VIHQPSTVRAAEDGRAEEDGGAAEYGAAATDGHVSSPEPGCRITAVS
jgi:hypothetical protein